MKIKNSCQGKYQDSLDIRFTKSCDNNCAFCIEREGIKALSKAKVDKMVESSLKSDKSTILILGGEPLLYLSDVIYFVKKIRPFKKEIYVTTSLPENDIELYRELLDIVDGMNVSVHHYDYVKNNRVLMASNRYDRISFLGKLLEYKEHANKIRLNINLVKGTLDTKEEVLETINFMESIGAKHIKFQELQGAEDYYIRFEDLGILKKKIHKPYHGCQSDISALIFDNPDEHIAVTLKRSCFLVQRKLTPSFSEIFDAQRHERRIRNEYKKGVRYTSVLYEDGSLSDSWKKGGEK